MRKRVWGIGAVLCFALLVAGWQVGRASVEAGEEAGWELALRPHARGVNEPTAIRHAGDDRLFVTERAGRIRIIAADGRVLDSPFLDIRERVEESYYEQGLLGLAFHPRYGENGHFYVNYTESESGDTVVARYRVRADNPNRADPASALELLRIVQPFANHNGGDIHFGPDGMLYIATGDGGASDDPGNRAQDRGSLLGKMLRIDVDGSADTLPYAIPSDNPWIGMAGAAPCGAGEAALCSEVWALGLRNPWRFSFDRATGDLWIGDVGQNAWEEINRQPASSSGGENYGWRCYEGTRPNPNLDPPCTIADHVAPVWEYDHSNGVAVTGGYVYRGTEFAELQGHYIFADFYNRLWSLTSEGDSWQLSSAQRSAPYSISSFGEGADGTLYAADFQENGTILRVVPLRATLHLPIMHQP